MEDEIKLIHCILHYDDDLYISLKSLFKTNCIFKDIKYTIKGPVQMHKESIIQMLDLFNGYKSIVEMESTIIFAQSLKCNDIITLLSKYNNSSNKKNKEDNDKDENEDEDGYWTNFFGELCKIKNVILDNSFIKIIK